MKAPFHFEFQIESSDSSVYAIRDGYFMIELDQENPKNLKKMADFLIDGNGLDKKRAEIEKEFGPHDIQSTSGTLISWVSCEVDSNNMKKLMRKWKKVFEAEGFQVGDVFVIERSDFDAILANQSTDERNIIDDLANGDMPSPRQTNFAFKV